MPAIPSDFRLADGSFDTAAAREAGVFEIARATMRNPNHHGHYVGGIDGDFMNMRLKEIDRAVMGASADGLLVNDPAHRPERIHPYVPSRMPTNATPSTSGAWI